MGTNELELLKAVNNCTDEDGLPIRASEAAAVIELEKAGYVRIAGEHQDRLFILDAGCAFLAQAD